MLEGWNWYHKSAVFVLWGLGALLFVRAVMSIDGGTYEVSARRTVAASPEAVWPWVTETGNRARWLANVVDFSPLTGEVGDVDSTRMMFWRERYRRWTAIEVTREILPSRLYRTVQQSDADTRIHRIELGAQGDCTTEIVLTEQIRPAAYTDRLWSFLFAGEAEERLEVSLEALDHWISESGAGCQAGSTS